MQTLEAAGFDWRHAADGVDCLTELRNFGGVNGACREVFSSVRQV